MKTERKGDIVILISDKIDFKKNDNKHQRRPLYDKGLIHQKVYTHTHTHTYICKYIKQHWVT